MATYNYPQDGRLHTRYSELIRCTEGQIERVVNERFGDIQPFQSDDMIFGDERHKMLERESLETGLVPLEFVKNTKGLFLGFPIDIAEKEFSAEIFKGIVLHSQPDGVSRIAKTLIDYKITCNPAKQFSASRQQLVYAFILYFHGVEINRYIYLCEIWNKEKTKIIGYDYFEKFITYEEIMAVKPWLMERCYTLKSGVNQYQKQLVGFEA